MTVSPGTVKGEKSKTAFIFTPAATATGGGAAMTVRF